MSPKVQNWSGKDPHTFSQGSFSWFSSLEGTFDFGPIADNDTGSRLKISTGSNEIMEKLDKVPIHNLAEERSVGLVNYDIQKVVTKAVGPKPKVAPFWTARPWENAFRKSLRIFPTSV